MTIQINTLYRCDTDGRLRSINEPGDPCAPRFFLGRTCEGNLWRFRHDLPSDTVVRVEQLCQAEPIAADLTRPPQHEAAIKAILNAQATIHEEYRGPAYWIPAEIQPSEQAVLIDDANVAILQPHFAWMATSTPYHQIGPVAAVVERGQAVAICFCSRIPGQATEAGVETVAAYRGRGYATTAVATWAAAVHRLGRQPLYSTEWTNLASQAIARKLGMVFYGEDWSLS
jgi:hypothetical protein